MNNGKIVFWDWNGTLWDDVTQWFVAASAAYKHANISSELTLQKLQDAFDVPVRDVIYTLGAPHDLPQENHDRLLQTFTTVLAENEDKARRRDGAFEALEQLELEGIENFIVSNHPRELLIKELEKGELSRFFETVCGNDHHDQVYTKGTKRDRIETHLEETGIKPANAFIVADTREEIRIAREFGMTSIAITGGYNSENALLSERPNHIITHLNEVPALVIK